jgi:hypothetical protein
VRSRACSSAFDPDAFGSFEWNCHEQRIRFRV